MKNTFTVLRSKGAKVAAATAALVLASGAHAAIDTSEAISELSSNGAQIIAIGGALLVLCALVASIAYTKRAVR